MSVFTTGNVTIPEGLTVYSSDNQKLGKVISSSPYLIVVEKGLVFPADYYIPTSAVAQMQEDGVWLTVTKDEALNQGWENEPVEPQRYEPGPENQAMLGTVPPAADVGVLGAAPIDVNPGYAAPGRQEENPRDDPRTEPEPSR